MVHKIDKIQTFQDPGKQQVNLVKYTRKMTNDMLRIRFTNTREPFLDRVEMFRITVVTIITTTIITFSACPRWHVHVLWVSSGPTTPEAEVEDR